MSNASSRRGLEDMLTHGAELPLRLRDPPPVGGSPARDIAPSSIRPLCPSIYERIRGEESAAGADGDTKAQAFYRVYKMGLNMLGY